MPFFDVTSFLKIFTAASDVRALVKSGYAVTLLECRSVYTDVGLKVGRIRGTLVFIVLQSHWCGFWVCLAFILVAF